MKNITIAICWAAIMLLLAFADAQGWIAEGSAQTMFVVVIALFVATGGLARGRACWRSVAR